MRILALVLLAAPLLAQDLKVSTPHKLIPAVTSPFTVKLEGEFDIYAFWLEGASSKKEQGSQATFEASPGVHRIRGYGLAWENGVLLPKVKKESRILVLEAPDPAETQTDAGSWQDAPSVVLNPTSVGLEKRVTSKPFAGVTIAMMTDSAEDSKCRPCIQWWREKRPQLEMQGARVEKRVGPEPWPQWRMYYRGGRLKWTTEEPTSEWVLEGMKLLAKTSDEVEAAE